MVPLWALGPRGLPTRGGPEAPPPASGDAPAPCWCGCPRSAASPTPCGSPRHGRESPPGPAGCGRGVPHRCTGPQGRAYWAWGVHERGPPLAAVARRPWSAPSPKGAHPLQAVGSARGGEAGLTHRLHLLPAKGRPASRRSIFSRRTSPSIVSSPTLALSRAFSSSRSSAGRALSAASPPRRNARARRKAEPLSCPTRGRASPGSRPAKDAGPPPACAGRRTDPAHCDALGPWLRSPYGRPPPKPPLGFCSFIATPLSL